MTVPEIIGLIILGFAMGAQICLRSFWFLHRKKILFGASLAIVASITCITVYQYIVWKHDPVSKFLLPPHQGIGYFAGYVFTRLIGPWLASAAIGIAVWFIAKKMNARFDNRFFEDDEPFLFGFAAALVGYPTCLFYIVIMFIVGLLWSLGYAIAGKGRAPLYYLWLPVSVFAILYVHFGIDGSLVALLKF
jgi:hypothetical protein